MKALMKILVLTLVLAALVLSACSKAPAPVNKSMFDAAQQEMVEAERIRAELKTENTRLTNEEAFKTSRRDGLQIMVNEKK